MLLEILKRTPPWVFVLFAALVFFGLMQSRTRQVGLVRVAILPLVLIGLSLSGLLGTFGASLLAISVMSGAFLARALRIFAARSAQVPA